MPTCTIIKLGRSDPYGRPFALNQVFDGTLDQVRDLVRSGFATTTNSLFDGGFAGDALSPADAGLTTAQVSAVSSIAGDGVAAPVANLTAAVGSAGVLTGTYFYSFAYGTATGVTAPWPGTATSVAPSSQQVNLTAIPVSSSPLVTSRYIYRTKAASVDPKDYFLVGIIANNTQTTYTDNVADGSLGAAADWAATNRGNIVEGGALVASFSDQSTTLGQGAGGANIGYASTAIGYQSQNVVVNGRRNTSVGTYSLTALTSGYQNTAFGVHAGGGLTVGIGNTLLGYAAGSTTKPMNNFNVLVGQETAGGAGGANVGTGCVAVGYRALFNINTADSCIGIGQFAGAYANASRQVFIDAGGDRTTIANGQDIGLIYGKAEATAQAQDLRLNAITRIGPGAPATALVANLQAASTALRGYRGYVVDASVAYTSANIGTTVAGGGANVVPVFCTGSAWVIG